VHVKVTVRRRGDKEYRYLSLVESVRVGSTKTHRTLLRLGEITELRDSGQLDRIIAALRAHAEGTWVDARAEMSAGGAPSLGAVAAVHAYFCRLGLDHHFAAVGARRHSARLEDSVFTMVANRLCDPVSKRRTVNEWLETVSLPAGVTTPNLDQCYRALDAIAATKEATESLLYERVCDLTNLDLRLVCYDLTSTYFESAEVPAGRFPSRAYGYSRDHRGDRPQVMIGLLVTGDGIPIAHHVFAGNTADVATLPAVMADLQARFGVGRIALVADRGLISEANLEEVAAAGFDHVIATRLHRDPDVAAVLEAADSAPRPPWQPVEGTNWTATEVTYDGSRYVIVSSPARKTRDDLRREQLLARVEDALIALDARVQAGRLKDPAKIGAAADRILRDSGVGRCFVTHIRPGRFSWEHNQDALRYEEQLLAGRFVITTSLTADQASTADVVHHYKSLQNVERRFRILKDFLALRPVYHHLEQRVRGHIALCAIAAVIEALIGRDLQSAGVADPDIPSQTITARRALAALAEIRQHHLDTVGRHIELVDRPNPLQHDILAALDLDTAHWAKATIT
jgi:Transposase DDE domain